MSRRTTFRPLYWLRAAAGLDFPGLWSFIEEANNKYIHRPLSANHFPNLGRPRLDAARFAGGICYIPASILQRLVVLDEGFAFQFAEGQV